MYHHHHHHHRHRRRRRHRHRHRHRRRHRRRRRRLRCYLMIICRDIFVVYLLSNYESSICSDMQSQLWGKCFVILSAVVGKQRMIWNSKLR